MRFVVLFDGSEHFYFWQAVALFEPTYFINDPLERIQNIRLSQYGYGAKWAKKNLGFQFPGVCKLGLSILFLKTAQIKLCLVMTFSSIALLFAPLPTLYQLFHFLAHHASTYTLPTCSLAS